MRKSPGNMKHIPAKAHCLICGQQFRKRRNASRYCATHTPTKIPVCLICNSYPRESLFQHIKSHYLSRGYECCICQKIFSNKSDRKDCMKSHKTDRAFWCTFCGQMFQKLNEYIHHYNTHTAMPIIGCETCCASFTNLHTYKGHCCETYGS